jgi:energy-coupling factor transporter ATP-binding protein EcfA2
MENYRNINTNKFIDPRNDIWLLGYLKAIRNWHKHIEFLDTGIAENVNTASMVPSDKLFITPKFSKEYIDATADMDQFKNSVFDLEHVLENYQKVFIKGDPGTGKSTLVNRLSYIFSKTMDTASNKKFGFLIPFPIVLREMNFNELDGTWENFIKQYFKHIKFNGLSKNESITNEIFTRGQAFFLLDGLDEIVLDEHRKLLSGILNKGMEMYPDCKWWFTTRLVGFSQHGFWQCSKKKNEPITDNEFFFEQDLVYSKNVEETVKTKKELQEKAKGIDMIYAEVCDELFISPFDNRQIKKFADLWYNIRERRSALIDSKIKDFFDAVMQNPSIQPLARIPLFITMIALYYEVNQIFPDGRVDLYRSIAKAYLKDINRKRKIPLERSLNYNEQYRCMGKLALKLQEVRTRTAKSDHQLSISQVEAEDIFLKALLEINPHKDKNEEKERVKSFFNSLKKNSEILIPKTENTFSFLHLSYQEFFAAEELRVEFEDIIIEADRQEGFWKKMKTYAQNESWTETIILFFEGFRTEENKNTKKCKLSFDKIFGWDIKTHKIKEKSSVLVGLKVLTNAYIGESFPPDDKHKTLDNYFIQYVKYDREPINKFLSNWGRKSGCLIDDLNEGVNTINPNVRWIIINKKKTNTSAIRFFPNCTYIDLTQTQVTDISPLKDLKNLRELDLNQTQVTDISPLKDLKELWRLDLNQTQVTDISPLKDLKNLKIVFDKE